MTETADGGKKGRSFSMTRLMVAIITVTLIAFVAFKIGTRVQKIDPSRTKSMFGLDQRHPRQFADGLTDSDGDLVADVPAEATNWVDPRALMFSFVASPEAEASEQAWRPLVAHLARKTGKPVQYVRFHSAQEQLKALKDGRLHVTAVNTGNVPLAVASSGFVPAAMPATSTGKQGYTMMIIVPAHSPILTPADLAGKYIAFTTPGSNSGFKAPMEVLMYKFQLEPEADFQLQFSGGHEKSIAGIAEGEYEAAAVASDLLEQSIVSGAITVSDFRTIYTSELFPAVAIGYVHNLKPELAESVRSALLNFDPQGTSAAEQLGKGVTGFAPVSYKDDWALVRRIDEYRLVNPITAPADSGS
jgi:phosphonate transport system substrate-binding protein